MNDYLQPAAVVLAYYACQPMLAIIYTFDKSILAIPWCVGGIALVIGFYFLRRPDHWPLKVMPFMFAAAGLGAFGPGMLNEKIEITSDSFHLQVGSWWEPTVHAFAFKDVQSTDIILVPDLKGRRLRHLHVKLKNGGFHIIPIGTLFRLNEADIFERVRRNIEAAK